LTKLRAHRVDHFPVDLIQCRQHRAEVTRPMTAIVRKCHTERVCTRRLVYLPAPISTAARAYLSALDFFGHRQQDSPPETGSASDTLAINNRTATARVGRERNQLFINLHATYAIRTLARHWLRFRRAPDGASSRTPFALVIHPLDNQPQRKTFDDIGFGPLYFLARSTIPFRLSVDAGEFAPIEFPRAADHLSEQQRCATNGVRANVLPAFHSHKCASQIIGKRQCAQSNFWIGNRVGELTTNIHRHTGLLFQVDHLTPPFCPTVPMSQEKKVVLVRTRLRHAHPRLHVAHVARITRTCARRCAWDVGTQDERQRAENRRLARRDGLTRAPMPAASRQIGERELTSERRIIVPIGLRKSDGCCSSWCSFNRIRRCVKPFAVARRLALANPP
jgi:hypothetical protein